jgi:hypothetical protein
MQPSGGTSGEPGQNMFLKNLDRAMLTFNMHNMAEVCFNHVFRRKAMIGGGDEIGKLTEVQ